MRYVTIYHNTPGKDDQAIPFDTEREAMMEAIRGLDKVMHSDAAEAMDAMAEPNVSRLNRQTCAFVLMAEFVDQNILSQNLARRFANAGIMVCEEGKKGVVVGVDGRGGVWALPFPHASKLKCQPKITYWLENVKSGTPEVCPKQ